MVMKNLKIEKTITTKASIDSVWSVFADPAVTAKMGGTYISDWKIGSEFNFRADNGTILTHGKILELVQKKLLKHELYDKQKLLSTITYEFTSTENLTTLTATEELNYEITDQQFKDINLGWDGALQAVKNIAETL
jgi:uncharacterized protein YndB with AHSA1/START domain